MVIESKLSVAPLEIVAVQSSEITGSLRSRIPVILKADTSLKFPNTYPPDREKILIFKENPSLEKSVLEVS
jgi:hypothetical protein